MERARQGAALLTGAASSLKRERSLFATKSCCVKFPGCEEGDREKQLAVIGGLDLKDMKSMVWVWEHRIPLAAGVAAVGGITFMVVSYYANRAS